MKLSAKLLTAISAAAVLASTPAFADTILLDASSINKSYTFDYNGFSDGTTINGLTAQTTFTLTSISGNDYNFSYAVKNTTQSPLTSRLSGFGFNTNPDIMGAQSTGAFGYTTIGSSYPNGIGAIDVCFKDAKTGSCSGGAGGGLVAGASGTGTFKLSFASPITSLTLGDFYVRYQSITGAGNITSASGVGTNTSTSSSSGGTPVPEPGMVGLFGLALAGFALLRRRRSTRLSPAMA